VRTLTLPAIELHQNGSRLIVTKMQAVDLKDFTVVEPFDHAKEFDDPSQGYQRPAEPARVKQFANYLRKELEEGGGVRMPTAILLSGRNSAVSITAQGTVTLKSSSKLPLIDGQHRARGFEYAIDAKGITQLADYEVPVVILLDIDKMQEMRQFATVNGTQKSVRTDLVNMILTQLASKEGDEAVRSGDQWKVVVSQVVSRLNSDERGPWYDRIVMPDMAAYSKQEQENDEKLRHRRIVRATSFMTSLKPIESYLREHFEADSSLARRSDALYKPVDAFWRALQGLTPEPFETADDYVMLKTPGLFALHKLCLGVMKDMYRGRREWDVENFTHMLKDGRLTDASLWYAGSAGDSADGGEASKYGSMKGFAELADMLYQDLQS
jgi:DGQHR domain-containing protein